MQVSIIRRIWITRSALALWALTACQSAPIGSHHSSPSERKISSVASIDSVKFEAELKARIDRIPEFKAIQDWARARNVRVWLAGGSATGIASYLREELQSSAEDVKKRFPYSYYDIYRSTQDADIVLDGDEKMATELETFLRTELGHLQGSKSIWEVRLLKSPRGEGIGKKDPIIGDINFRNQNSDSYSLALVELTDPPRRERRVRDAFHWDERGETPFFRDLLEGKLTYYRNPAHSKTARALAGWNPEIISVIRAFSKSYQYDAVPREESLEIMTKVVEEFNPNAPFDSHAVRYILGNSGKIFQHSRDLEATWNALEKSGLRRKLIQFAQRYGGDSGLVTLLNREPIRSYPLGQGPGRSDGAASTGKTARALGLGGEIFSHETNSFLAYENITMSRDGKPNFFISRNGRDDEAAAYGDGLYGRRGRIGARGTGLTIRFELNPDAVEGRDFYHAGADYYVFLNANAIRILPEDRISMSISEFMTLLDQGNFSVVDRGVLKKLELKMTSNALLLSDTEVDDFYQSVRLTLVNAVIRQDRLPASLALFMSMAKKEPRLKELLAFDFVLAGEISPLKRLTILNNYGLLDGVFASKLAERSLRESLVLQTNVILRWSVTDANIRVWERNYRKMLRDAPEDADKILRAAIDSTVANFLPHARKQFAVVGMERAIDDRIVAALRAGEGDGARPVLYELFNERVMKLPSVPDDLRDVTLRDDNPARVIWEVLIKHERGTPQHVFDGIIDLERIAARGNKPLVSNWWALVVGYFEKAYAVSPNTALASMKGVLQRQRASGRFSEIALHLFERVEFREYVGEQAVAKLATAAVFLESKESVEKYFQVLNRYLEFKGQVPRAYRSWATHPRNPQRLRWIPEEKIPDTDSLSALRRLCSSYEGKTSIQLWLGQWRALYADAARESSDRARNLSLEVLQGMRGATFGAFASELTRHGMGEDVADLAIAKLATYDVLKFLGTAGTGEVGKTAYYDALNEHLATLPGLPKSYAKYALATDNPLAERWKKLPSVEARSSIGTCVRMLKRAF